MSQKTVPLGKESDDSGSTNRVIFENALEGIAITDSTHSFIDVNPSCCKFLGYNRSELLQLSIFDVLVIDEYESKQIFVDALLSTKLNVVELRLRRKDGLVIYIELTAKQISDGRLLFFLYDITESKKTKETSILTEQGIQSIISNSPFGSFHYELQTGNRLVFLGANPAADAILGVDNSQFIGKTIEEAFPLLAQTEIPDQYRLVATTGERFYTQQLSYHDEKIVGAFEVFAFQTFPNHVTVFFIDVTERKQTEEALRESESKYRRLFETMVQGIVYQSSNGDIISANPSAERILGLTLDQMQGKSSLDPDWNAIREDGEPLNGEDHPAMVALKTGKVVENFVMGVTNNRSNDRTWISVTATPLFKPGESKPYQVYATFDDITESKLAFNKLLESEERFRTLFHGANEGIFLLSEDGNELLAVNESYARMHGYTLDELKRISIKDLDTPQSAAKLQDSMQLLLSGEALLVEVEHFHKDGHCFPLEVSASVVTFNGKKAIQCFHRDISERKKTEVILREIIEQNPLSIQIVDQDGYTVKVNQAHTLLFGAIPPPNFSIFDDLAGKSPELAAIIKRIKNGEVIHFPDMYYNVHDVDPDLPDTPVWIRAVVFPLKDNNINTGTFVVVHENITEQKHAEHEKVRLETQLQQAQKMESIGRLAGGVAHDFNNMLGVILGHAEISLETLPDEHPIRNDLEEIRLAANRSADLTRQLLAFARKQAIAPKVLNLNEAISDTLKMLHRLIGENISLSWLPSEEIWNVKIDPSQIDQILANLCVNARDAINGVGKIVIETKNHSFSSEFCSNNIGFEAGDFVRISISDSGSGMDVETLSHVFEPFFTTKEIGKGTGLGLATVYGAVKQNNGFVNVNSTLGRGTTFSIYIPRYISNTDKETPEIAAEVNRHGNETILLVEDEPAILKLTTTILQKFGYNVVTARTPKEAIQIAQAPNANFDLLITDVVMPDMNGRELSKILGLIFPNLKHLFMSGYTADIIASQGVLDENVNFIQKPFSMREITLKVREMLDRK